MSLRVRIESTKSFKGLSDLQKKIYQKSNMIKKMSENYIKAKTVGGVEFLDNYTDIGRHERDIIKELLKNDS